MSPTSVSYDSQVVLTTSAAKTVTVKNGQSVLLNISSITTSGDFAETTTCGSTLAAGASCTISVTFTPTAAGSRTGTLTVTDDASNSPQTASLSGTGLAPASLDPNSLSFGNQVVGTTSAAKTVTLKNNQTVALSISSIATSGDYAQSNTCSSSLAAGASCTISVTFTPTVIGSRTGTLTVTDSASNSPQTASLSGTGIAPVTLTPSSLSFDSQVVGTSSAAKTVTLKNNQTVALGISSIATSGDYAQSNTCGTSLGAGASCTISVTFTPTGIGSRTGTLTVTDNASNSPQTSSLSGSGVNAAAISTLSPTSGTAGTSVTITGTNFGSNQESSTVSFNGTLATPTSWSATSIHVPVPSGATTGNVTVTVSGKTSNGVSFTVVVAPSITSLSPTSGAVGTSVTITGANFGLTQGSSTVTFNGVGATPTSWSATSIVAPVPTGASSGNVVVTVSGMSSNGVSFTVTVQSPPSITSLSPTSGEIGAPVTITGTNFGATQGASTIAFNGTAATAISWTPTSIATSVPTAATTGNVVVTVSGVSSNGVAFTVVIPPSISASASPAPNSHGWNNSNVTVTFTCTAHTYPIQSCQPSQTVSSEAPNQIISGTVTDTAGYTASASVTVSLDKTYPVVSTSSPANGSTIALGTSTIGISGADTDGVSGVATVTCNGTAAALSGSNFSCNVNLVSGSNSISVQATDLAGNTSSASLTLNYSPAPQVTITSPANLTVTNLSPVTVTGAVSDPSSTVVINGISVPQSGGSFSSSVPLVEGLNVLSAVATNSAGISSTATIQITLDTTPPHITIDSPADGTTTTASSVTVSGSANDIVVGTVNNSDVQVSVNGTAAQVANRSYSVANIPLAMGGNTISATGTDKAGNSYTTSITVTRVLASQPPQPAIGQAVMTQWLTIISGNNQSDTIGTQLSAPVVVTLTDSSNNPVPNQTVLFKVTGDNGLVSATTGGTGSSALPVTTDTTGTAQVYWTLGQRAGAGINTLTASSALAVGPINFSATGLGSTPSRIVVDSGNNQTGILGQPLAYPFVVDVVDSGYNRVPNVPVTFTLTQGDGNFSGTNTITVNTDSNGRSIAVLTIGYQQGINNNVVTADFPNDQGYPASFAATAEAPGNPANTTISGVVLDNSNNPIPGATIRLYQANQGNANNLPVQIGTPVQTNAQGTFQITSAPVGSYKLMADGSTATAGGPFPTLEYDIVTVAGTDNTVGMPIFLPALDTTNKLCVDATHGGTLTLPQSPGFALTVLPGSATFPGGSKTGCITVTPVNGDKVPMSPGFGQQPRFVVTIQPVGTMFNPPAPITLPNVDGLPAKAVTEMYSYDHDLGMFIAIGTGTVSDDGSVIASNSGVGVLKAGWHCGGNPNSTGSAGTCPVCQTCQGQSCVPSSAGTSCSTQCMVNGKCNGSGSCSGGTPSGVSGFTMYALDQNQQQQTTVAFIVDPSVTSSVPVTLVSQINSTCQTVTYTWDFGDGTAGSGSSVPQSHIYAVGQTYNATFTATCQGCPGSQPVTATLSITIAKIQLQEVDFLQSNQLFSDPTASGSTVTPGQQIQPMWQAAGTGGGSTSEQRNSISYTRDATISLNAKFQLTPPLPTAVQNVTIQGDGPDGISFIGQSQSLSGATPTIQLTADSELADNVQLYNPFGIVWTITVGNNAGINLGQSQNKMYVTWSTPIAPGVDPTYETVINIATQGANGATGQVDQTVVDGIWSVFASLNVSTVQTVDAQGNPQGGVQMTYWKTAASNTQVCNTVAGLIAYADGACTSWAQLLAYAWLSEGLQGFEVLEVLPDLNVNPGANGFLIKTWDFGLHIQTGPSGVRQSNNTGDDSVLFAKGSAYPYAQCITAGGSGTLQTQNTSGDDQILAQNGIPVAVSAGANGVCETTAAAGDIQVVAVGSVAAPNYPVIGPGPNGTLDSTPTPPDSTQDGIMQGNEFSYVIFIPSAPTSTLNAIGDAVDSGTRTPAQGNNSSPDAFGNHYVTLWCPQNTTCTAQLYDPSYGAGPYSVSSVNSSTFTSIAHETASIDGITSCGPAGQDTGGNTCLGVELGGNSPPLYTTKKSLRSQTPELKYILTGIAW